MSVTRSPQRETASRFPNEPASGFSRTVDAETEETEKKRKADLKALRRIRTMRKNLLSTELATIKGLQSESPVFPTNTDPEVMAKLVKQHADEINELTEKICSLIEEEEEWAIEEVNSAKIAHEATSAVAAIETAVTRLRSRTDPADIALTGPSSETSQSGRSDLPRSPNAVAGDSETRSDRRGDTTATTSPHPACAHETSVHVSRLTREYDMTPRPFSGNRLQFRTFRAEFEEYVGNRDDVSDLRKLMILRKFLEGEPLIIVEALELNNANYQIALSLLEKNYARTGSEKSKIISEIRNLPMVSRPYDSAAISRLVTTAQSHISILAVNGVSLAEIALTMLDSLQAALPVRLRQEFLDQQQADERYNRSLHCDVQNGGAGQQQTKSSAREMAAAEVEALIEFLRQRLRNMEKLKQEKCAPSTSDDRVADGQRRGTSDHRKRPQSTIAAITNGLKTSKKSFGIKQCLFCKSAEHSSSRCSADITLMGRCSTLEKLNRCKRCFRPKHASPTDCQGPRSVCSKCKTKDHYTSMHPERPAAIEGTVGAVVDEKGGIGDALLWTASVYVVSGRKRVPIRIFVDPGSSLTVATPSLCEQIQAPAATTVDIEVQAFVGAHSRKNVPVRSLRLVGPTGGPEVVLSVCEHEFDVNPPNMAPSSVVDAIREFDRRFPVADRSYFGQWQQNAPVVLLGMDQIHRPMLDSSPRIIIDNIRAHQSHFGWIIGGPLARPAQSPVTSERAVNLVCCAATRDYRPLRPSSPAQTVEKLWTLETIGIADPATSSAMSADEESAVLQFDANLTYSDNRYSVGIPKRPTIRYLSNNYEMASQRLERRLSQLRKNPDRYKRYHEELMKFVHRGYAVELPDPASKLPIADDEAFYMPHHEVVSGTDSAEKWRIVFDCSAKTSGGTSLNDHLLTGPNLNPDLVTLLLNFRVHEIAVSADIAQAYMQIAVTSRDQHLFRFLWQFPDESEVRVFQMQRVTWGAAPSGFLLAAVLREHFKRSSPGAETKYGSQFYADDYLASYPDVTTAIDVTCELRKILRKAGMELAKWKTNSQQLVEYLRSDGVEEGAFDSGSGGIFKVLGLAWSATEDTFRLRMPQVSTRVLRDSTNTKREALSVVASLFDPLGWLTPFSLRGKLLIQRIWSAKLDWNQRISPELQLELSTWVDEMGRFSDLRIPRRFAQGDKSVVAYRLHLFGDASTSAFAAAAYIEAERCDGTSTFSLVMSRSRLAPLTAQTLPRWELLAALMAVRLAMFLTERLTIKFAQTRFYTDSMITYHWVTSPNPGNWKTFIHNRVREIQQSTRREDWYHVTGDENVADLATRGITAD